MDGEVVPADLEGVVGEAVPGDGGCGPGMALGAGEGEVDRGRDVADQAVTGQRGGQAQRCGGGADGDLDQIGNGREVRFDEDPAGELLDETPVPPTMENPIGDIAAACVGAGEDRQKLLEDGRA